LQCDDDDEEEEEEKEDECDYYDGYDEDKLINK